MDKLWGIKPQRSINVVLDKLGNEFDHFDKFVKNEVKSGLFSQHHLIKNSPLQQIQYRSARLEDLEILYEFEQGIIQAERPFDPTLKSETISYYDLKALINDVNTEVAVAVIDGQIIASAYAQIREAENYLDHERYAYLGFMFVKPEYRGQGINLGVIKTLEVWIKKQGVSEVRLDVYAENEAALKAYAKGGFEGHMLNMRKRI